MKDNFYTGQEMENLLVQFITGTVTDAEKQKIAAWLKESRDNRLYFEQLKDLYFAGKVTRTPSGFNREASMERVKAKYYKARFTEQKEKERVITLRRWMPWAAAIVMALGMGYLMNSLLPVKETPRPVAKVYNEVVAPKGSRSLVRLPDGTSVWLNAGSTLKYPMNFLQGDREVILTGEAFFDVAKVAQKRFIVNACDLAIKVWGTKFNVKAYPEEKTIETTLVEGSVSIGKVKKAAREKETYLTPNQTAIFYKTAGKESLVITNNNALPKKTSRPSVVVREKVNTILYTSWKDDKWVIEGEELGNLATQLERRYNVNITFEDAALKDYRFTGTFTNETFEQLLEIIKISAPIDFTINNNEVHLKENKSSKKKYDEFLTR